MKEEIFIRHELPQIFRILDGFQVRADNLIHSKESPTREYAEENPGNEHLQKIFGCSALTNSAVDQILKEVHFNYLELAKEVLQEESIG